MENTGNSFIRGLIRGLIRGPRRVDPGKNPEKKNSILPNWLQMINEHSPYTTNCREHSPYTTNDTSIVFIPAGLTILFLVP